MRTPNAHQSTARPYFLSSRIYEYGQLIGSFKISIHSAIHYLGSHEFGSTTERAGGATVPHVLLTETIISNLDVTVQGQKNVVKLQDHGK